MTTKMRCKKQKRTLLTVLYDRSFGKWIVTQGVRPSVRVKDSFVMKESAIHDAAIRGEAIERRGGLAELVIKNKDGRIGTGHGSRRTYGKDPRRTKG